MTVQSRKTISNGPNKGLPVTNGIDSSGKQRRNWNLQRFVTPINVALALSVLVLHKSASLAEIFLKQRDCGDSAPISNTIQKVSQNALQQQPFAVDKDNAVEIFRNFMLNPPAPQKVPYSGFDLKTEYYSQVGQDKVVDRILKKKENGFFIECGAYDGSSFSNSLFFEKSRGWTGLLIEANPRAYRELLQKDRKAWSTPACISTSDQVELGVEFLAHGMVGGYGSNRFEDGGRLAKEMDRNPYVYRVKANCFPLNVMLDAIGVNHVDMFSLDVEGVELNVLQAIDWDRVTFSVLVIETNGQGTAMDKLLRSKGYSPAPGESISSDLVYVHNSML